MFSNNRFLFKDTLNKFDFIEPYNVDFWHKAILQYVWLDDLQSTTDNINLHCSFLEPETNAFRTYKIYFNNQGNRAIELVETS